MTIIYLHGFQSDGEGSKYETLKSHFKNTKILSPDLPANPKEVQAQINTLLNELKERGEEAILMGTSLGGFYSLYFSAIHQLKAVIINPSLQPYETLERGVGHHKTYKKGRPFHFKQEYLEDLRQMKSAFEKLNPANLYFFLSTDDELLDHKLTAEEFSDVAHLSWWEDSGHRFTRFGEILKEVEYLTK